MERIAVLLTCHNRKDKTINCIQSLKKAIIEAPSLEVDIYLTDDGSTDGTGKIINEQFPEVIILKGNGFLFWAGGMRNSWREALKNEYDGYLLLNDDTNVTNDILDEIIKVHQQTTKIYGAEGIYVGSTKDSTKGKISYGGSIITNRFFYKTKRLEPNGTIQLCELGNANIMCVSKEVVSRIGILSKDYVHGAADYDYTLKARKKKIPVVIMSKYCGECDNDHPDVYENFNKLPFKGRVKRLYNPSGLAYRDRLRYMQKNFPYRFPFVLVLGWLQILFPRFFISYNRTR